MNALDQLDIPGLMVATEAFVTAARVQTESLGFEPNIIWVAHPIQNRSDNELRGIALQTFQSIVEMVIP